MPMPCRMPPTLVRVRFDCRGNFFPDKTTDCGWIFAQHFCNRLGASYLALKNVLNEANPAHEEVLMDIKRRFRDETFTRESVANVIHAHPELVRKQIFHIPFGMLTLKDRSACCTLTSQWCNTRSTKHSGSCTCLFAARFD